MTLREINDILLDLAEPYKLSPMFDSISEPVASDDDSSMTLKVYFKDQVITITCDGEGNIEKKNRKRKLSQEEEDELYGQQLSLFDLVEPQEENPKEQKPKTEEKPKTVEKEKPKKEAPPKKEEKPAPKKEIELRELKTKVSGTEEPVSPFKLGDIVCLKYDESKQYVVDGVSGYVVRCKIVGQLDACYMTSSDLKLIANQH